MKRSPPHVGEGRSRGRRPADGADPAVRSIPVESLAVLAEQDRPPDRSSRGGDGSELGGFHVVGDRKEGGVIE